MKTEVITTLPMDPKRAQELFLFTTPFAAHLIAKGTGRELYLPINRVGEADSVQATPYRTHHSIVTLFQCIFDICLATLLSPLDLFFI